MRATEAPTCLRVCPPSSARATSIAPSSIAPSSRCASGPAGWGSIKPASIDASHGAFDEPEAVAHADLAPQLPAEHRGRVEQRDALHRGVFAGVEEGLRAGVQHLQRIARRLVRQLGDPLEQGLLDVFVDGLEELALALEVVIKRPPRDTRRAHDLLRPDGRVATLGEQSAGGGDERRARRLRALGLERTHGTSPLR